MRVSFCASAPILDREIEFAGRVWTPSRYLAFTVLSLVESLPAFNQKGMCVTAKTLGNSVKTCLGQVLDLNHDNKKVRPWAKGRIVGTMLAYEYPSRAEAIAMSASGTPAVLRVLCGLQRKQDATDDIIVAMKAIMKAGGKVATSVELEWDDRTEAWYDPQNHTFIQKSEAPADLIALYAPDTDNPHDQGTYRVRGMWRGRTMLLAAGGEDGFVDICGGAIVTVGADPHMQVHALAASADSTPIDIDNWPERNRPMALTQPVSEPAAAIAAAWEGDKVGDHHFAHVPDESKGSGGQKSLRRFPLSSVTSKDLDGAVIKKSMAEAAKTDLPAHMVAGVKARLVAAAITYNLRNPHKAQVDISHADARCIASGMTELHGDHRHPVVTFAVALPTENIKHGHGLMACGPGCTGDDYSYGGVGGKTAPADDPTTGGEHQHLFVIGPSGPVAVNSAQASSGTAASTGKEVQMAKSQKEVGAQARVLAAKYPNDPDMAQWVNDYEAQSVADTQAHMATLIASALTEQLGEKVKSGELVTKDNHAAAIASAKAEGAKEVEVRVAAAAAKATVITARNAAVSEAKIPAALVASAIEGTPTDEAGQTAFSDMLAQWKALVEVGQKHAAAAAAPTTPVTPVLAAKTGAPFALPSATERTNDMKSPGECF